MTGYHNPPDDLLRQALAAAADVGADALDRARRINEPLALAAQQMAAAGGIPFDVAAQWLTHQLADAYSLPRLILCPPRPHAIIVDRVNRRLRGQPLEPAWADAVRKHRGDRARNTRHP